MSASASAPAEETTYLELSEPGGAHKFYEVIVRGGEVSIRFGRIGDAGKTTVSSYPTPDKARAEAQKKIAEKLKKGYERAQPGVRKKRSVTRREVPTAPPPPAPAPGANRGAPAAAAGRAPILWTFDTHARAFGLFVDAERCWVGNDNGAVFALDDTGAVRERFRLPDGVKCLIADGPWRYAGCDDGNVYDLSGKAPRVAYEIADDVDIYWLDVFDGVLAVSDAEGRVTVVNHEDESQWQRDSSGARGWMVRCDEIGVYHGHSKGVTMYDWDDGAQIWDRSTDGMVFFGWQEESMLYAGTTNHKVCAFTKQGEPRTVYGCDHVVYSCAAAPDGAFVFAADGQGFIYCFAQEGQRLWKLPTGIGAALSMQYRQGRLYLVTNTGQLACLDVSEDAIRGAAQGRVPKAVAHQAPQVAAQPLGVVETAAPTAGGILAECYDDGGKARVRILSPGFDPTWHCQFPKDIRKVGARYLIQEVRPAARGGYYRALGEIRRVQG